jgi:NTE family protein
MKKEKPSEIMKDMLFRACCFLLAGFLAGCAHYPRNTRLAESTPQTGYRYRNLAHPGNSDSLQLFLAFSGGGTRAAALSYGVLQELARTPITWEGQHKRLLDEVDHISAVSGGSFTAAYYALYGDRIFSDFEAKFLNQNIERQLIWQLFWPVNWYRLASPNFNRSDMAAKYYDHQLFHGATFADLIKQNRRPFLVLNATDMSLGATFQFTQDQFDLLCSDLSTFPISRAVAASAAYPILLSPITLNNYAGSCECTGNPWLVLTNEETEARGAMKIRELRSYQDVSEHPYLHLLDGGLADNLGLRGSFETISARGGIKRSMQEHLNIKQVSKVVLIVVNASTRRDRGWDRSERPPNIIQVTLALGGIPSRRYSFETMELLRASVKNWEADWNEQSDQAVAAGAGLKAQPHVKFYVIEVSFDDLREVAERSYFENLPTTFNLPPKAMTRLEAVAGKLLDQSPDYRALLRDLAADSNN